MITPLGKLRIPPEADETSASFCSRTAFLNGRHARDFCLDFGMHFQKVVDGDPSTLEKLANLTGANPEYLLKSTFRRTADREYWFRGEKIRREGLVRAYLRICPACVADDLQRLTCEEPARPYQRSTWLLSNIRTCSVHNRAITHFPDTISVHNLHDFTTLIHPRLSSIETELARGVARTPSSLETYLCSRLDGTASESHWLSGFRFDAAAKLCETVGAVGIHGIKTRYSSLTEDQLYEAGGHGFEIVSKGARGIRDFLSALQDERSDDKFASGPKKTFSKLYEWLSHESDDSAYDPMRTIMAEHCVETMPLGPGDQLFGKPIPVRKLHSIHTASLETGLHPKRFRKLLQLAGHIGEDSVGVVNDRVLFDAAATQGFIERVVDSLTFKDAAEYINVPRPHDRGLFESGLIRPLSEIDSSLLSQYVFVKSDLDEFLSQLLSTASDLKDGEQGFMGILQAQRRACCAVSEIVKLIMEKKLSRIRKLSGERGFMSVLVDVDEVKPLVRLKDHGGLSLRKTEKVLGVTTGVLNSLIGNGVLAARSAINPTNRCPQTVVDVTDIEAFRKSYVSLIKLAQETGIHFNPLKKILESSKVPLAFDRNVIGSTFYRRDQIPDLH
ncbi:TniQ family protein [Phyllobacterium myrsinacearum]|uniref:TniQ domain-containing protein n=1 Tax=Phyllobacterium myrsinacearum TaxID=28101 RepID=A0A839ELD2_9HYPH|nr:TniQ family protein [Phyllobacterium myrsinacearum]MBA8878296.1 hypothetical protein [Phyllobacterium myrsinacearum]